MSLVNSPVPEWSTEMLRLLSLWYSYRRRGIGPLLYQNGHMLWEFSRDGIGCGRQPSWNIIRRVQEEELAQIVQQQEIQASILALKKEPQSVMITRVEERLA